MLFHIYKNYFLKSMKTKSEFLWILIFPIALSILFYIAFGNIFEASEKFKAIPVAVVTENDSEMATGFKTVADTLSAGNDDGRLLDVIYVNNEEEATNLLKEKDVYGIIYAGDSIDLTLTQDITDANISQSILKSFVERFNMNYRAIIEVATNHPENLHTVLGLLDKESSYNAEVSYSNGNMDIYVQYFYNLIAMTCLYTSLAGLQVALKNQANLSDLGARKNISPVPKLLSIVAELASCITVQFICVLLSLFFMIFVLKINFGGSIPYMILTSFVGCICGVTLGFFIGSISHFKESVKIGMLISISMICCFFSGLMIGNMHAKVEAACPLLNRINPASLISDCFYSLNIYDTYTRFTNNIITLLIISAIFCLGGFVIVRRTKYASL